MGNVVQAGVGQNPARQAALRGEAASACRRHDHQQSLRLGIPKAVALAAQSVTLGESDIVVAGGMESMSNCPYLLPEARSGYRLLGDRQVIDSMIHDGLWDVYEDFLYGRHRGTGGREV